MHPKLARVHVHALVALAADVETKAKSAGEPRHTGEAVPCFMALLRGAGATKLAVEGWPVDGVHPMALV